MTQPRFALRRFTSAFVRSALLAGVFAPPAQAMSVMPMSDSALLQRAQLVVTGTVRTAQADPGAPDDATRYSFDVDQVFKGRLPASTLDLHVPGAVDSGKAGALIVDGAPHLEVGDQRLLFLSPRRGGGYVVTQMSLGNFALLDTNNGGKVFDRDLPDAVPLSDGVPSRRYRDANRFEQWLRDTDEGRAADDQYWSSAADAAPVHHKFLLDLTPGRWFDFADAQSVAIYASQGGADGVSDGAIPALQQAIAAWNNDSGSDVALIYAGTTSAAGGLSHSDGISEVLFNDPNDEIDGSFDCANGGVIAYTTWRANNSSTLLGILFRRIAEADTVVQDGTACMFNARGKNNAQEALGHELGHLLGLAHPCGDPGKDACISGTAQDDALMRPLLHSDGRGARLGSDDRAGLSYLYGTDVTTAQSTADSADGSGSGGGGGGGGGGAMAPFGLLLLLAARRRR